MSDRLSVPELNRLTTLAREIRKLHDSTESLAKLARTKCNEAVAEALLLGHALNEVKQIVGHGKWLQWLEENCPNIKERTARNYMRLANRQHVADLDTPSSLRQAYITAGIIQEPKAAQSTKPEEMQPKQKTIIGIPTTVNISTVKYLKHPIGSEQTQPEPTQDRTENANISPVKYFEDPPGLKQTQTKTMPSASAPEMTNGFLLPRASATDQSELMESDPIDAIHRNVQVLVNAISMLTDDLRPRAVLALEPLAAFRSEFYLYQWEEKK